MREQEAGNVSRRMEATAPSQRRPPEGGSLTSPRLRRGGSGATVLIRASIARSCCLSSSWQPVRVFRWTPGGGFNFGLLLHHNGVWCPVGKTRTGGSSELVQVVEFVWPSSNTASKPSRTAAGTYLSVGSKAQRCNSFRRAVAKIPSWKISRLFLEARCLLLRFDRANATQNLLVRDWINPGPRLLWLILVGVWPDRQTPDLRSHSQKHTHTTEKKASQHPVFWTLLLSRNRVSKPASP